MGQTTDLLETSHWLRDAKHVKQDDLCGHLTYTALEACCYASFTGILNQLRVFSIDLG